MTRTLLALLLTFGTAAAKPQLVVFIAVDQLRPDTLMRFRAEYAGGLKKLLDGGLRFRGVLDYAATETGPGHATMLTGCYPAHTGIIANTWIDRQDWQSVYCCEAQDAPVFGVKDKHRSPELLLKTTLGDWMKAADAKSKVFSVSAKDRAAVLMGGRGADGAYWLERAGGGMTSSAYYHKDGLPAWVSGFNADGWIDHLPEHWTYTPVSTLRADDDPRESDLFSRASPHPLRGGGRQKTLARMYASPYGDAFVLRFARRVVEQHELGADEVPDLLAISLSSTDTVGHAYGPFSQEIRDTLLRLDRNLGAFFAFLDARKVTYSVALTADHGVLPLDDRVRVDLRPVLQRVAVAVQKSVGAGDWFRVTANGLFYAKDKKVRDALLAALRLEPAVEAAFDREGLKAAGPLQRLLRNSFHTNRSGDIVVVAKEKTLVTTYPAGTSHGSPWRYDREVPVLFFGPGVPAGERGREIRLVDVAPTLAGWVGVVPPAVDGVEVPLK